QTRQRGTRAFWNSRPVLFSVASCFALRALTPTGGIISPATLARSTVATPQARARRSARSPAWTRSCIFGASHCRSGKVFLQEREGKTGGDLELASYPPAQTAP